MAFLEQNLAEQLRRLEDPGTPAVHLPLTEEALSLIKIKQDFLTNFTASINSQPNDQINPKATEIYIENERHIRALTQTLQRNMDPELFTHLITYHLSRTSSASTLLFRRSGVEHHTPSEPPSGQATKPVPISSEPIEGDNLTSSLQPLPNSNQQPIDAYLSLSHPLQSRL
ncbi:hypothetical protein JTE90_021129 [Oedothorax gibbosus]|uniref:Uncharacterized protein n=1 Tax=Oedothorax gibbosus TaxID=931172 RepID=A0AAV6TYG8_9ARAC|nr:hypothetical protein JTE90_021129 [Oedothorax gibbosus]